MDHQSMFQDMNPPRRPKPPSENQLQQQQPPPPPPQKCPRCDSLNTKFCYYNNYSLTQPRYFCKGCRRYWTHGGTLRNVPVGGGCRKGKRARLSPSPSSVSSPSAAITSLQQVMPPLIANFDQTQRDARANLGIASSSSSSSSSSTTSSSSSPYFPAGGFLSSLAAMNMRSLSPLMMNQPPIHHQVGLSGQGFNSSTIPNLAQNQQINDNFCRMLANEREPSNMEPMFVHQQQQQQQQQQHLSNRGLVPPWALSNHHHHHHQQQQQQQQHQNIQMGNPSFWNSNNRNTGSSNNTTSSMMSSLSPNQWLNLPGSGPDSSSSMIDKKP